MRVASNVGNPRSEFGHAKPSGSRVIRYVRDGRTDKQTDKSKAYCPYKRGITIGGSYEEIITVKANTL